MKIENSEQFFLSAEDRQKIEDEIKHWKEEENRLKCPCLYLLKMTNLQNKLDWDNYLKNGYSEEDKKLFEEINSFRKG